jgi:hypothetical protein
MKIEKNWRVIYVGTAKSSRNFWNTIDMDCMIWISWINIKISFYWNRDWISVNSDENKFIEENEWGICNEY